MNSLTSTNLSQQSTVLLAVVGAVCLHRTHGSLTAAHGLRRTPILRPTTGKTVNSPRNRRSYPTVRPQRKARHISVWMYSCDGGKTKFPGFLERYTPQAKARLESALVDFNSGKSHIPPSASAGDAEVKKPGPGNPWVSRTNYQQAHKITNVQCPDGSGGTPEVQIP